MKKLVNVVQNTRNEIWTDGKAKKLADDFEQKALKALTEWLHDEPSRAIAYNIFSFEIKAIAFSDATILLENAPITGWDEWDDVEFSELSENDFIMIDDNTGLDVKNIKPFIDELINRGYKLSLSDSQLCVSFEMPKE